MTTTHRTTARTTGDTTTVTCSGCDWTRVMYDAATGDGVFAGEAHERATAEPHVLTVFNAVDLPNDVAHAVMALLNPYDPDCYTRACDATGRAL